MYAEIELELFDCEYRFSKIRRLALNLGINPTPRWFKDEVGTTEHNMRRVVALDENGPSATYQFLNQVKIALINLEKRLKAEGGDEDPNSSTERQLLPRRLRGRRGRDLLD